MGILRPKIQVLDEDHKNKIYTEAKDILEHLGIFLENENAKELFNKEGISHEGSRYYIPSDLVEKCLKAVPNEIKLYDREGKEHITLGNDNVHFDPGSAAILYFDETTGEIRNAVKEDFIRFSKVVEHLKYIEAQSTALIYQDVPKEAQDWHRLFIALTNCYKPVVTGTFRKESFAVMKDLLLNCRLSEDDLARKPLAIFDTCPSAPLQWSELTVHDLLLGAQAGIPIELISMPQLGATGPITLAGSLLLHNAESLSGVVLTQLAAKGAPVIYGGSPTAVDMQYGTARLGAIESIMLTCAYAQMANHYNLPSHGYLGLSDAKIGADAQSGYEAATGLLLGAMAGLNNIAGAGMLIFESTQSFEKIIIDDVLAGMVKRFIRGITVNEDTLALSELRDVGTKGGDFLRLRHTLTWFRKEHFMPGKLVDRQPYESWLDQGALTSQERAREQVNEILSSHEVSPLTKSQRQDLDAVVKTFMKRHKASSLPEGPR